MALPLLVEDIVAMQAFIQNIEKFFYWSSSCRRLLCRCVEKRQERILVLYVVNLTAFGVIDISACLKVYTTPKGHDIYVTGNYHVDAFESKSEVASINCLWYIDISTII